MQRFLNVLHHRTVDEMQRMSQDEIVTRLAFANLYLGFTHRNPPEDLSVDDLNTIVGHSTDGPATHGTGHIFEMWDEVMAQDPVHQSPTPPLPLPQYGNGN